MNRTTTKKKMAFSLMRLITILALAFVVPSAMAARFTTALSYDEAENVDGRNVDVTVTFGQVVSLAAVQAERITVTVVKDDFVSTDYTVTGTDGALAVTVPVNTTPIADFGPVLQKDLDPTTADGQYDGKTFTFTIPASVLPRAAAAEGANAAVSGATQIYVSIPLGIESLDPGNVDTSVAGTLTIDLRTVAAVQDRETPAVVSIQRLRPGSQTVVSAFQERQIAPDPFDVRIVLTERPHGGLTLDKIQVDGGTASNLVVGVPFAWHGGRDDNNNPVRSQALRPHPSEGGYYFDRDYGPLAGVELTSTDVNDTVPLPTGADGMYHQYRVTITPHRRVDTVKISIKEFHDRASSFKPDSREQLRLAVATTTTTEVMASLPQSEGGAQTKVAETGAEAKATANVAATADVDVSATESVKVEVPDTSVMIPMEGLIYISEIMFARGKHGTLTQWIEISNGSRTEQVNLSGWTLTVENATADADVSVGAKAVFTIPEGTRIDPSGQHDTPSTILVVTEQGRNNLDGAMADGQVVNLWTEQQLELFRLDIFKRRYSLLSDMAFQITLAPPAALITTPAAADATDVVGNLGADGAARWALPIAEGNARSSIIRRHVAGSVGPAEPKDGEMMESWVLASDTNFGKPMHLRAHSYYGLPIDIGTPGFRAGGALPVELSHFRPVRDKETGAVVITWSTQSELNNAGFFIKRRQQRDGEFQIINVTMIPGAGTTSEKQFYTYTDTTAQPNVVYYYQIEDVSLDGNRQTLTRGIRLKGHVSVAGKLTTLWGELKRTN